MASGVFGTVISEETVTATGEYKEPVTQKDVADYAMKMINAGGKDVDAQKFLDNLKDRYGNGITTKCLIYNATGTTLNFSDYYDWHGHVYETSYPSQIQNGQWGAFLHVHSTAALHGSEGAVVYRTKLPSGSCDWLFSWCIPFFGDNTVYTELGEQGHFPPNWRYIIEKLDKYATGSSTHSKYGYLTNAEIGGGTTSDTRAVFQLPY
ncbi:hypothetical protein ZWY2020_012376 [Hordeum vulgare]|nr:hypothetical protein ZWY2020_012376 [Hordeum vulgare]